MKFEHRKSEIIKGHEIVKTPREHWFKIKIYVESSDGFCSIQTKTKACGLMKKKTETKLGSQRKLFLQ